VDEKESIMSSKNNIIGKIRSLKLAQKPLPEIPDFKGADDLLKAFCTSILGNKGEILSTKDLITKLESGIYPLVYSTDDTFGKFSNQALPVDVHSFSKLDLAILKGQFGVAENGAIWLDDSELRLRAIPFITEHLVIVISRDSLVATMHQAYDRIGDQHSGFGLFIAGPSKTADIEQSLVIGAHGAKSLMVVLI
jgi:L-lactate dehydrogenase complex protein LldG